MTVGNMTDRSELAERLITLENDKWLMLACQLDVLFERSQRFRFFLRCQRRCQRRCLNLRRYHNGLDKS